MKFPNLYSSSEAMKVLGMTQGQFQNLVRQKRLQHIIPPGRTRGMYLKKEVDELARVCMQFSSQVTEDAESTSSLSFTLTNYSTKQVQLAVEPWGDTYPMAPKETFTVTFQYTIPGMPEITIHDDMLVAVYPWKECHDVILYRSDGTIIRS